jgi:diaminohydroxyphosphoribosylaminopyrimidine deaminase/5-amino-6-(5-phosphoribosylamino)uracil reductase
VAGKGIEKLQNNGIEVIVGVLEKEARQLNKRFFIFMEKKRPYIILKWAMSKDFFIAKQNFEKTQISNPISKKIVHQWRNQEQGIMVGKNTAFFDNPLLNAREWTGKQPTRIILDRNLSLPPHLHIFDKSQPTIVYNFIKNQTEENLEYVKINIDTFWKDIFQDLYEKKIQSILIEGGTTILQDLLEKDLYDEIRIFQSDKIIEKGIPAPIFQKKFNQVIEIENDILYIFEKEV